MKIPSVNRMVLMSVIVLVAGGPLLLPSWCAAELITEVEGNNSLATAQSVDGHFTLDYSVNIGDGSFYANTSTTIPHVTVVGTGDGTFDYYSFYFPGPGSTSGKVIFDIDDTSPSLDSHLALWAADGTLLFHNDDYDHRAGAGGSISDLDSLIETYISTPGTYIVGVARWNAGIGAGGYTGGWANAELLSGDAYTLQISVEGVPEPATLSLLVLGGLALLRGRRKK
jgi:hypothetical protein